MQQFTKRDFPTHCNHRDKRQRNHQAALFWKNSHDVASNTFEQLTRAALTALGSRAAFAQARNCSPEHMCYVLAPTGAQETS